jgi:hypothetical protein
LWQQPPLSNIQYFLSKKKSATPSVPELVTEVGPLNFASLVHSALSVVAELEVVILKPGNAGGVVRQGGDLDNQLKTLLDALRQPHAVSELPKGALPSASEDPFFCLLEDDQFVTRVDLSVYRWLGPSNRKHVHVDLLVRVKPSIPDTRNLILV